MWTLEDRTNRTKGYFQIQRDGKRVCDAFPFAPNTDPEWIKEQCELIVLRMNHFEAQ